MRKKMKPAIGIIAFGLFLVASPFLISHAQKKSETQNGENKNQDEHELQMRQEVAKSVVGSFLFDTISIKEPKWELSKANYWERDDNSKFSNVGMSLKKRDNSVGISISEFDSAKDADQRFQVVRSYGASVPFNTYGDKGEKLVGERGDLIGIRFRKDNFFVSIFSRDPKTAERFAVYALDAIKSHAK